MGHRPLTLDHLASQKKPVTRTVPIVGDSELAAQLDEAQVRLRRALAEVRVPLQTEPGQAAPAEPVAIVNLRAEVAQLEEQVQETTLYFKLKSIGRKKYEAMVMAHPPTEEQIEKYKAQGVEVQFNEDTFGAALLAACLVEPIMTSEQVNEYILENDDWNAAEVNALTQAAVEINMMRSVASMGNGSRGT